MTSISGGGISGGSDLNRDGIYVQLPSMQEPTSVRQGTSRSPREAPSTLSKTWEKVKVSNEAKAAKRNKARPQSLASPINPQNKSNITARTMRKSWGPDTTKSASPKKIPLPIRLAAHRTNAAMATALSGEKTQQLASVTGDAATTVPASNKIAKHNIDSNPTQGSSALATRSRAVSRASSTVDSLRPSSRTDSGRFSITDSIRSNSVNPATTTATNQPTATPTINPAITAAANAPTATAAVNPATTAADEAKMKEARAAIRNNYLYTGSTRLQIDGRGLKGPGVDRKGNKVADNDQGGYKSIIHYLLAIKARQLAMKHGDDPELKQRFEAAEQTILLAPTVKDALEWADIKLGIPNRSLKSGEEKPHKYDKFFEGQIMEDALKLALQSKFMDWKTGEPTKEGQLLLSTGDQPIISQDDSGSTKWQDSYTEHYLDKKGKVIKKYGKPVTNSYKGNNLMGQELEKIRAKLQNAPTTNLNPPTPTPGSPAPANTSEYQNLPSPEEMLARTQQTEARPATSHYQSLPVDDDIKRRHEEAKRAAEEEYVASWQTRLNASQSRADSVPDLLYPAALPQHAHVNPDTGKLTTIYNLFYNDYLQDGLITPLEKGRQIATSYTQNKVVEFYREQETPDTKELGNFHPTPIKLNFNGEEHVFPNAEAAFQAAKVMHMFSDDPLANDVIAQLKNTTRGDEAFAIMSEFNAKLADDETRGRLWGTINQQVMYQILMAKFSQNPELREKLLSTGNKPLIENTGGFGKQTTWGVNTSGEKAGKGQNQLGRILEVVRDSLRS